VLEVAGHAADAVVDDGAGAVEADRRDAHAKSVELLDSLRGEQGRDARRDRERKAQLRRARGQGVEVGTHQHVPSGGDEHGPRHPKAGQLLEQALAFICRELAGRRLRHGARAAVTAGEPAGPRRLPEDENRPLVEIHPASVVAAGAALIGEKPQP
jgi:hypothetical protein